MTIPMMKCGCAGQALLSVHGSAPVPGCGLHQCVEPAEPGLELAGRTAFCSYGRHGEQPSSETLAFFRHHPGREHDEYYCGCFGWV